MTLDRYGDPIEDDTRDTRTRDEIHARCEELRRILRESRARRQVQP